MSMSGSDTDPEPEPGDYTVGWICALPEEYIAAQEFLDVEHERPRFLSHRGENDYTLGKIKDHNVVITLLPLGEYGTASAGRVAKEMLLTFPNIRIGLMVGIGGGVPTRHDVRLGDIVVSTPGEGFSGVFQYDFGKSKQGEEFRYTGVLNRPPTLLSTAVGGLKAFYDRKGHRLDQKVKEVLQRNPRLRKNYAKPDLASDALYASSHTGNDPSFLILRAPRSEEDPVIHYGLIASGNQVMKDALIRDRLAQEKNVLCFEMEAAGLMNHFPCLVIRGICDYSDSHKNEEWQGYAAMVAAAYAKDLLCRIIPQQIEATQKISEVLATVNASYKIVKDTSLNVLTIKEKQTRMHNEQRLHLVAKWLAKIAPVSYAVQKNDLISRQQERTGSYLLDSNEFQGWLTQSHGIPTLFCPGIPGAGKTMMTSIVIAHLQDHFKGRDDQTVGIAYIFCDFRQQSHQKPAELLMNLLKQFAKGQHLERVKHLHEDHHAHKGLPPLPEIIKTMGEVLLGYSEVVILIDALDELQVYDDCEEFMETLFKIQARVSLETRVRIFATSRARQSIESLFKDCFRRNIHANVEDVTKFLDGRLEKFRPFVADDDQLKRMIKEKILGVVDGMFLLAQLYIDSLASETTVKGVKRVLEDFDRISPHLDHHYNDETNEKLLDQAYEATMRRIKAQSSPSYKLAEKVLSWTLCATRRLTSLELQCALAVEIDAPRFDKDNLTDIELSITVCEGLVIIDHESKLIRFVHHTAQVYLDRTWANWFPKSPSPHVPILRACITYLSFDDFESGQCSSEFALEKRLKDHPLYEYAAKGWGYHANRASMEEEKFVLDFLQCPKKLEVYSQAIIYPAFGNPATKMTSLHVAAYFGLHKSMSILLQSSTAINQKDAVFHQTPLFWAYRFESMIKLLLDNGADLEIRNVFGLTLLSSAVREGSTAIVKLLLEHGANIEPKGDFGHTPLMIAAQIGSKEIVRLLLDKGANVHAESAYGQTPLSLAMRAGTKDVIMLLIGNHAKPPKPKEIPSSSVLKLSQRFPTAGYNPNLLTWAAEHGREDTVESLIRKGADITLKGPFGRTPLALAARYGHIGVVRLLLDAGAQVEMQDTNQAPLSLAARYGHGSVVQLLLDAGAKIESKTTFSNQTPLSLAARKGHEQVVKLLLEAGAEKETRCCCGHTPLSLAALEGHVVVMMLLLDGQADVEARNRRGFTPLIRAAIRGQVEAVQLLLINGADIEAMGDLWETALLGAILRNHKKVVEVLLDNNANVEQKGMKSRISPYEAALSKGDNVLLRMIQERLSPRSGTKEALKKRP